MPPAPSWRSTRKRPISSPGAGKAAVTVMFYLTSPRPCRLRAWSHRRLSGPYLALQDGPPPPGDVLGSIKTLTRPL
ncbi:hypothetical protein GCM10023340_41040 [Nocardioides marinquilinus]|uniref:Uncharacterized protein n=1 Tax=Nocardioides marinquilinus TaxID=1210400 RepID=A0ABP9Q133_9ACTN